MYIQGILLEAGYRRTVSRKGELWRKPDGDTCYVSRLTIAWVTGHECSIALDDERGARARAGLSYD